MDLQTLFFPILNAIQGQTICIMVYIYHTRKKMSNELKLRKFSEPFKHYE